MFISLLSQFKHEAVITVLVSAFLGAASWPFRTVKKEWSSLTNKLDAVHVELSTQRNNCLTTLQNQGNEQIELLGKVADTLGEMRLDNREMLTHLRDKL